MSPTSNRQHKDLNASNRVELYGKINYMFCRTEMETWLEVLQWKDSSCKMLTAANCLEDILALQLKTKINRRKEIGSITLITLNVFLLGYNLLFLCIINNSLFPKAYFNQCLHSC